MSIKKKLALRTETLRTLTARELDAAAGGNAGLPTTTLTSVCGDTKLLCVPSLRPGGCL